MKRPQMQQNKASNLVLPAANKRKKNERRKSIYRPVSITPDPLRRSQFSYSPVVHAQVAKEKGRQRGATFFFFRFFEDPRTRSAAMTLVVYGIQ
jgi:hypothetical protein